MISNITTTYPPICIRMDMVGFHDSVIIKSETHWHYPLRKIKQLYLFLVNHRYSQMPRTLSFIKHVYVWYCMLRNASSWTIYTKHLRTFAGLNRINMYYMTVTHYLFKCYVLCNCNIFFLHVTKWIKMDYLQFYGKDIRLSRMQVCYMTSKAYRDFLKCHRLLQITDGSQTKCTGLCISMPRPILVQISLKAGGELRYIFLHQKTLIAFDN